MEIDKLGEQIILGSLLGDAGINKDKRYEGYGFADRHSLDQVDYLLWKHKQLPFNFKAYEKSNLCTLRKNNKVFKEYRELFYKDKKKVVTKEILDRLNPLGLAVWYMDDGNYHYRSNVVRIYTQSFELEGNQIIKEWFEKKLNINIKIKKIYSKKYQKAYFYIEISTSNAKKFINIIKDHIIKSMEYKIGLDEGRRKLAKAKLKEYSKKWWKENEEKRKQYYISWKKRNNKP
jgi:hypothetical protein